MYYMSHTSLLLYTACPYSGRSKRGIPGVVTEFFDDQWKLYPLLALRRELPFKIAGSTPVYQSCKISYDLLKQFKLLIYVTNLPHPYWTQLHFFCSPNHTAYIEDYTRTLYGQGFIIFLCEYLKIFGYIYPCNCTCCLVSPFEYCVIKVVQMVIFIE